MKMQEKQMDEEVSLRPFLPKMEFSSDKTQIEKGETVILRWTVKEAEKTKFWENPVGPSAPELLNWERISELGKKVKMADEVEVRPEETTAYYLVSMSPLGMRGKRIVVEVLVEKKEPRKPYVCSPPRQILNKMDAKPHLALVKQPIKTLTQADILSQIIAVLKQGYQWTAPPDPPLINISANPPVIFEDETSVVSWNISNANSSDHGVVSNMDGLTADPTDPSGAKLWGASWGSGGAPPCTNAACMSITNTIKGQQWKQNWLYFYVHAHNVFGKSASESCWVDILSIPQFTGEYSVSYSGFPSRQAWIRDTLKKIDEKLENGCILNDVSLDQTVDAFKKGYLSRKEIWINLRVALQNMKIVTFKCENVPGTGTSTQNTAPASWKSYGNVITFRWKPDLGWGPSEYAVMHELVHKCGFHDALFNFNYTVSEIEDQTDKVASACMP
jgi:hypothetical protein